MDIGTYTIDDYHGNGDGAPNLSFQIASGQNFFNRAVSNVEGYSAITAPPGLRPRLPTLSVDKRNTQVNRAAMISTNSGVGGREYCDFIFYGGHGLVGGVYLGAKAGYGNVAGEDMNLGVGFNRWMLANGCSLFNSESPATTWRGAFRGLKALLSFKSVVFDNNLGWDLYNDFWYNWTYGERSLYTAFFDAQTNYGYKHLYPTYGLEPGCLSAQVLPGHNDHCLESFLYTAHDYAPGIPNTGHYYSKIIGAPVY